jgi:hypothetical protein
VELLVEGAHHLQRATHVNPHVLVWCGDGGCDLFARRAALALGGNRVQVQGGIPHFTPSSGSSLNMVEIFFGIITRRAIRRSTFTSVGDLIEAITGFIDGWNYRCQPSVGTEDAKHHY